MAIRKSPYKVNAEGIDEAFVLPRTVEPEEPLPPAIKLRKASRTDGDEEESLPEMAQKEAPVQVEAALAQEGQEFPVSQSRTTGRTAARTSARTSGKTSEKTAGKTAAKKPAKTSARTQGKTSGKAAAKPSGRKSRAARATALGALEAPVTMEGQAFPAPSRTVAETEAEPVVPSVSSEVQEAVSARQRLLAEANRAYMSKARSVAGTPEDLSLADLHDATPNRSNRTGYRPDAQTPRQEFDMFAAVSAMYEELKGEQEPEPLRPHAHSRDLSRLALEKRKASGNASERDRELVSQPAARSVPRSQAKAAINALLAANARGQRPVEEAESWADESLRLSQPGRAEVLTERKPGRSRKDRKHLLSGLNESPLGTALRDEAVPFAEAALDGEDLEDNQRDEPDVWRDTAAEPAVLQQASVPSDAELQEAPVPAQDTVQEEEQDAQSAQSAQEDKTAQAVDRSTSPADLDEEGAVPAGTAADDAEAECASDAEADQRRSGKGSQAEDEAEAAPAPEDADAAVSLVPAEVSEDLAAPADGGAESCEDAVPAADAESEDVSEDMQEDESEEESDDESQDVSADAPEDASEGEFDDETGDEFRDASASEPDNDPALRAVGERLEIGEDRSAMDLSVSCADPDAGLEQVLEQGLDSGLDSVSVPDDEEEITGDICDVNPFGWGEDTTPPGKVRFLKFYTWSTLPTRLVSLRDSRGHFLAPGYFAAIQATRSSAPVLGALREAALRRKWHLCIQQLIVPVVYPAVVPFRYWQHCTNPFAHTMVTLHYLHKKVAEEEIRRHFAMALPPGQRFTLNGISTLLLQNSDVFRQFFSDPANKSCRGIIWRDTAGKIFGSKFPQPARLVNYAILNPDWIMDAQPVAGGTDLIGARARKNPKTCMERLRRLLVMDDAGLRRAIASEERRARKAGERGEASSNEQPAEYQDLHDGMEYVLGGEVLSSERHSPAAEEEPSARTTRTRKSSSSRKKA